MMSSYARPIYIPIAQGKHGLNKEKVLKILEERRAKISRIADERIPKQLHNPAFRFVKIRKKGDPRMSLINDKWENVGEFSGKEPYAEHPKNWRIDGNYQYDDEEFLKYLNSAQAYGIVCGFGNLVIVDFDNIEYMKKVLPVLSKKYPTYTVRTGSKKFHLYYLLEEIGPRKCWATKKDGMLIEIRGEGGQCLAPGSIHPSGEYYKTFYDKPILKIQSMNQLIEIITPFMPPDEVEPEMAFINKDNSESTPSERYYEAQLYKAGFRVSSALSMLNVTVPHESTGHCQDPRHSSRGGKPLHYTEYGWTCFHCRDTQEGKHSGNAFDLVQYTRGLKREATYKACAEFIGAAIEDPYQEPEEAGYDEMWDDFNYNALKVHRQVIAEQKETGISPTTLIRSCVITDSPSGTPLTEENIYRMVASALYTIQPYFYDVNGLWWIWQPSKFCYKIVDEVDVMLIVDSNFPELKTEKSTVKNSLKEALKKHGRSHTPIDAPNTWVQFKNQIVDIETGLIFLAEPRYFVTNPIPWRIGDSEDTPTIDKLFKEWVGDIWNKTLYEVAAYVTLPNYPIHRLFCLIGEGLNGKGTFINFLEKFVGKDNSCASDIELMMDSRFETSKLYRKLLCQVDEVDKTILAKTSYLKKLVGNGKIGFEMKNKNAWDGFNYAKIVMSANKMPDTTDKSKAYFRRWCIIDFPNEFSEKIEVLKSIPDVEYENLAKRCIGVLKSLLEAGTFTNEGSIEERRRKYEERASTVHEFLRDNIDFVADESATIENNIFYDYYNKYCLENKLKVLSRVVIGRQLSSLGYKSKSIRVGSNSYKGRCNMKWKESVISDRIESREVEVDDL